MFKRQAAVLFAACALCVGTIARADQPAGTADTGSYNPLATSPVYLDDQATSAPTSAPTTDASAPPSSESLLNDGLNAIGVGKWLTNWGIKVGGYVEGSYTYDTSHNSKFIAGRTFDFENEALRMNQLALQIARPIDTAADLKAGKWDFGFGLDMMYGSDGRIIHANGLSGYNSALHPINQYDLTQAYLQLFIPVGHGLEITAGKFVTLFGNESISPIATVTGSTGNAFYSHSYNFGFGIPFTQTGVLAAYPLDADGKWTVTGGFTRGWNQATNDDNGAIDFLGQVKFVPNPQWTFTVNMSAGPEGFHDNSDYQYVLEGIAAWTPKDSKWTFAIDALGAEDEHAATNGDTGYWYGVTGYVGYSLCKYATLNGRVEWFRDDGGAVLGQSVSVYEATVGATVKPCPDTKILSNLIIRPEVRVDWSGKSVFNGGNADNQVTAAVDAIFAL
jgi:hypothetical protein